MKRTIVMLMTILMLVMAAVVPASAQNGTCGSAAKPRLTAGGMGRVTPGLPNVMRSGPGKSPQNVIMGEIPANAVFGIVAITGPACADGMWWWLVTYNNMTGWTPESDQWGTYWTEPYVNTPACTAPAPRLIKGSQGRVLPGLPNVMRSNAWKGSDSKVLGSIPAGGMFSVIDGPRCANNIQWWLVSYNGVNGWTGEGELYTYWVEPVSSPNGCPANLPSRLSVGGLGHVTPGLPNIVRSEPTVYSRSVGQIPAGEAFTIGAGPICADGIAWWKVTYYTITGWTAEGRWGTYWLEPGS